MKSRPRRRRRESPLSEGFNIRFVAFLSVYWPEVKGQLDALDEQVMKLIRDGSWQELRRTAIRYGRRVWLPANIVLSIVMTRALVKSLDEDPDQAAAAALEAELEALHEEAAARGDYQVRPLDEFIGNLQEARQQCLPTVH